MKTEDVMTRRVVACRADTDLAHVARLMWENDCGSVPVVDAEDRVVGMVTDRDLCMSAHFQGRALRELRAATCMAAELVTCKPSEPALAVVKRMGEKRVRRIPVCDGEGRLLGLVSVGDLYGAAARAGAKEKKALHAALAVALTEICERPQPVAEEVAPALPSKRAARPARSKARRSAKV